MERHTCIFGLGPEHMLKHSSVVRVYFVLMTEGSPHNLRLPTALINIVTLRKPEF